MNPHPLFQHAFMPAPQTRMCCACVLPPSRSASRTSSQMGACRSARFDNTQERGELHVCSKPHFRGRPLREDTRKLLGACLPEFHLHRSSIIRNHGSVAPAGDELLAWRQLRAPSTPDHQCGNFLRFLCCLLRSRKGGPASFDKNGTSLWTTWPSPEASSLHVEPAMSCLCLAVRHSLLSALCHELNRCV